MPARDNQKSKVYAAEAAIGPFTDQLGSLAACQEYVDKVLSSAWVQSRWGRRTVTVKRQRYSGTSYGGVITLGVPAQNHRVILHELAHELCYYEGRKVAAHGPEFAAVMLALVARFLGREKAAALRAAYVEQHVRHRAAGAVPPAGRYRVVTASQQKARTKAVASKPLTALEQREAARLLRRAVASGMFGEPGRKPRVHAQTIARTLEKAGS